MDFIDKVSAILLCFMVSSFAAVNYVSPSPANSGTVIGNLAIFNWTDTIALCDHSIFLIYQGGVLFDNETKGCNATVSLANLSKGSFVWNVSEYTTLNVVLDSGANQTFTETPYIIANITYPHSLTGSPSQHFFFAGDACFQNITINETDSEPIGAARSSWCALYYNQNGVWAVYQNQTFTGGNHSYIFNGLNNSGQYAANCSITISGSSNSSETEYIDIQGASFCAGGSLDDTPDWGFNALTILGSGLLLAGVWWSI